MFSPTLAKISQYSYSQDMIQQVRLQDGTKRNLRTRDVVRLRLQVLLFFSRELQVPAGSATAVDVCRPGVTTLTGKNMHCRAQCMLTRIPATPKLKAYACTANALSIRPPATLTVSRSRKVSPGRPGCSPTTGSARWPTSPAAASGGPGTSSPPRAGAAGRSASIKHTSEILCAVFCVFCLSRADAVVCVERHSYPEDERIVIPYFGRSFFHLSLRRVSQETQAQRACAWKEGVTNRTRPQKASTTTATAGRSTIATTNTSFLRQCRTYDNELSGNE